MTVTTCCRLGFVFGALTASATLLACQSQRPPETPTEEFRRREPAWISGEIMGVDRVPIDQYNESTVHLIVTTESDENVRLELGPGWYMDESGLTFAPQQRIEFRGEHNQSGGYVAHSLRRGQQTVEIRNADGSPRWPNKTQPSGSAPATIPLQGPSSPPPATPPSGVPSALPGSN